MKIATEEKQLPMFLMKRGVPLGQETLPLVCYNYSPGNLILPFSESGVEAVGAGRDGGGRFEFSDLLLRESGR